MVDGQTECFQETLGGFQTLHVGEPLLESGEDIRVEVEGLGVLLDEAGGVVGNRLIAEQGFVEGLDVAGVQWRLVLDVQELGDLFEIDFFPAWCSSWEGDFVTETMGQG